MYNTLRPSNSKTKKFEVDVKVGDRTKRILFGAKGYTHYTEGHLDKYRKDNYIKRHQVREDFRDPFTAGYWSYHYLWEFKTYKEALAYIQRDLNK